MRWHPLLLAAASALLASCASGTGGGTVWLFGEQHDQPDHQRQVAQTVQRLAAQGRLGALVLEMAERGRSTAGLPADATPAQAQQALAWTGWPWDPYADVVMNAVRAGVPVLGGNQPRAEMRAAMGETALDAALPEAARRRLADAVRTGHCGLLPADQEPGMVRIQIARDRALAQTAAEAARAAPARVVVLLAGAQHVSRDRGVPLHLPPALSTRVLTFGSDASDLVADERLPALSTPRPDPCEGLRQRLATPR